MGVVYSELAVKTGAIPAESGLDHLQAAHFFFDALTEPGAPTSDTARLLLLGSVVTGQCNRRSDLDYFLIRRPLAGDAGIHQELRIQGAIRAVDERFHVRLEGKQFTEHAIAYGGHSIASPLWLSHALDIQDNYPQWAHRAPVEQLRPYAVNLDGDLHSPYKRSAVAQEIYQYFGHKVRMFSEAGEFSAERPTDLHRLQRALEAGKAYARKGLAIMALEGAAVIGADVTSKASMRDQSARLLEKIDKNGSMQRATDLLNGLDAEYGELLNQAATSGDTRAYGTWLKQNYLPACAASLRLSQEYLDYVDHLTLYDPAITFEELDSDDDDCSIHDSGSWSLDLPKDSTPSTPILVNATPEMLDTLMRV
ncbi:MAG TPA: hypothetical protein VF401_00300 [Candidatus Saccharimonadales bacterium]